MENWRKNLYVIWFAQFITMMGINLVIPFLPFFVRELGVKDEVSIAKWSGIIFSGPFIVSFFVTPFWGSFGDKFGRKLVMVRAIFGLGLSQFLISLSQNVYQLFILRLVQGAVSGFIPSTLFFVSAETPNEKKSYALGVLQSATSSGQLFGPLVGGILADLIGYRHIFQVTGLMCFFSGFLLIFGVTEVKKEKYQDRLNRLTNLFENYRFALRNRNVNVGLVLIFLSQTAIMMVQPIFALFVKSIIGDAKHISTLSGVVFSVASAFTVLSSPFWGNKNDRDIRRYGVFGYRKNLLLSIFGLGVSFVVQGSSGSLLGLIFSRALFGFFLGGVLPVLYSFISRNVDEDKQGGIMGIASSFTTLSNVVGPSLGGLIVGFLGLAGGFYLSAFISSVCLVIVMVGIRK